jgi:hypothetical protein
MMTRTWSSASARRKALSSSTRRPRFWALAAAGRFSQIRAMRPSSRVSYSMNSAASVSTDSSGLAILHYNWRAECHAVGATADVP